MGVKFGPAGNDLLFYEQGYKRSIDYPRWLKNKKLDIYEYSLGRGIRLLEDTALRIGAAAKDNNIKISVHAPYFVNFASDDEKIIKNSINYVLNSLRILKLMGGNKLVVHPGSQLDFSREKAFENIVKNLKILKQKIYNQNLDNMFICLETMGKHRQMGTLDEIMQLCRIDAIYIPTIDFGHINAFTLGKLNNKTKFYETFHELIEGLGINKFKNLHIHFSKIEYTKKGEKQHLTLADKTFGPNEGDFLEALVEILEDRSIDDSNITVICESKGIMAQDALILKNKYKNFKEG